VTYLRQLIHDPALRISLIAALLAAPILSVSCSKPPDVTASSKALPPPLDLDQVWADFRRAYPYSMQTVAVQSGTNGDNVVIVSEPSPHVTEADLTALLPGITFHKHTIGDDGFVIDAVARFHGPEEAVNEKVADLHRLLFFTAYRAKALQLPAKPLFAQPRPKLDVSIAPGDVESWILGEKFEAMKFRPHIGGPDVTFRTILELNSLVYASDPGGLVAWWIPKSVSINDCGVQARQFAIQSDLIIGALGDDRGVLVLGRERLAPAELLPPLRFETMVSLCGVHADELMQTINPQLLSCYISTEPRERWELNLLSPELQNTEFGTLLTISDVLLKSWSVSGLNGVRGFRDYPVPGKWPFQQLLTTKLETGSLVFNYNSFVAGRTVNLRGDTKSYSVTRTGVLPIAYLPEGKGDKAEDGPKPDEEKQLQKVHEAEATAYDWFAARQDPHLVRVVQYTALLQIFNTFQVQSEPLPPLEDAVEAVRSKLVLELFDKLRSQHGAERDALLKRVAESPHQQVMKVIVPEALKKDTDNASKEHLDVVIDAVGKLSERIGRLTDEEQDTYDVVTKSFVANSILLEETDRFTVMAAQALASAERLDLKLEESLKALATGWIHTPTLIYDENKGELALLQGGHNLVVKPPEVVADVEIPLGEIRKAPTGELRVNPQNLRDVVVPGRDQEAKLLSRPPREEMSVTLGRAGGGGNQPRPPVSPVEFEDWPRAGRKLPDAHLAIIADIRKSRRNVVYVLRQKDGRFAIDTGRSTYTARSHREAIDIVLDTCPDAHVDVQIAGMSADEADAFGLSLCGRRQSGSRTISAVVDRASPNMELPREFIPHQHNVDGITIKTFQVTDSIGHGEFQAPSKTAGVPAQTGRIYFSAPAPAMPAMKKSRTQFEAAIKEALGPAVSPKDFNQRFEEDFKIEMQKAFPNINFKQLKTSTKFFFQTQDQIFSEDFDVWTDRPHLG
jgi:hypothetical protein